MHLVSQESMAALYWEGEAVPVVSSSMEPDMDHRFSKDPELVYMVLHSDSWYMTQQLECSMELPLVLGVQVLQALASGLKEIQLQGW